MGERNAGGKHKRRDPRPVGSPQIRGGYAGGVGVRHAFLVIVITDDIGSTGEQRAGAHQSRAAQAENRDLFARKGRDWNHGNATSASTSTIPRAPAPLRRSKNE